MEKFKPSHLPTLDTGKIVVVDKDVWSKIINYLNSQTEAINKLTDCVNKLEEDNKNIRTNLSSQLNAIKTLNSVLKEALKNA